jgi:hypothetical protein
MTRPASRLVRVALSALSLLALAAAPARAAPGVWTVTAAKAATAAYDTGDLYGNKVVVTFDLTYKAGAWVDSPTLDWHEKFIKVEHKAKERWVHENNMYAQNPNSATLMVWGRRYIEAYNAAAGLKSSAITMKGHATLTGKKGKVTAKDLGKAANDTEKAAAVKKYLVKNGGRLSVTIEDIPSLNKPGTGEKNERLLLFDVGMVGVTSPRAKVEQYLEVDGDAKPAAWKRSATQGWVKKDLPLPKGFKDVTAPQIVTMQRQASYMGGEEK